MDSEVRKIDESEFRNKKTHNVSKTGCSSRKESNIGSEFYQAEPEKSRACIVKGKKKVDTNSKETAVERIGEANFKNEKPPYARKTRPSTRKELKEVSVSLKAESNKGQTKNSSSFTIKVLFPSDNAVNESDQGQIKIQAYKVSWAIGGYQKIKIKNSSLSTVKGNYDEDMNLENLETERNDEAGLGNKGTHFVSNVEPLTRQELNEGDFNGYPNKPSSFMKKEAKIHIHIQKIEVNRVDPAMFKPQKLHFASKRDENEDTDSEETETPRTTAKTNINGMSKKTSSNDFCLPLWSKDIGGYFNKNENISVTPKRGPSTSQGLGRNLFATTSPKSNKRQTEKSICFLNKGNKNLRTNSEETKVNRVDQARFKTHEFPVAHKRNKDLYTNSEEIEANKVDQAMFKTHKLHFAPKKGPSTSQRLDGICSATTSRKSNKKQTEKSIRIVERGNKNPCTNYEDIEVDRGDQAMFKTHILPVAPTWDENEDTDSEDTEIERTDESKPRIRRAYNMSKIVPSTSKEPKKAESATTAKKNINGMGKKITTNDFCVPLSSKNIGGRSYRHLEVRKEKNSVASKKGCSTSQGLDGLFSATTSRKSNKRQTEKSSFLVKKGDEDMDFKDIELEEIDEVDFKNRKKRKEADFSAMSRKNFNGIKTSRLFDSKDSGGVSIRDTDNSSSFVKKGGIHENMDSEEPEIEIIDEVQCGNKKIYSASKVGPSNRKEVNKADSGGKFTKSLNSMNKKTPSNHDRDKPSSFFKRGHEDEDMETDEREIEEIDKYEFSKTTKSCVPKFRQEPNKGDAASSKNVKGCILVDEDEDVSKTGPSNRRDIVNQDGENKSVKSKANQERKSGSASLKGKKVEEEGDSTNVIAYRTRSKKNVKNFSEFSKISLDSSDESTTSSSDGDLDRFDDEDFQVQEYDVQNESENEDLRKEKVGAEKQSLKGRHFSDEDTEEEKPNSPRCEFPLKKRRRLTSDASDKRSEGPSEVPQTNEGTNTNTEDDKANSDQGLKEGGAGKFENEKSPINSKDSPTRIDCDGAEGVNGLDSMVVESQEHIERQKTISPSRSENMDCGHHNGGVPSNCDNKPSPDSHGQNGHNEKPISSDEIETAGPTMKQQLPSKQYDFYRIIADSILENGKIPEEREINEERETDPEPQSQNTLPLKFRFEDEETAKIEKTEFEKEMDGLFDELNFCWSLGEMGSVNCPKVDKSNADATDGATPHAQCAIGKHVFVLQDETGLRCKYCLHEELGPRDVMPMWGDRTCRTSQRKRSNQTMHHLSQFDEHHLSSSIDDNITDFINNGDGTVWRITPGVQETMYEHQQEGLEFLWKNLAGSIHLSKLKNPDNSQVGGCIISHAPGTGKTRLSIVFLETYLKLFPDCRPVIVAPASMLLTWEEEFKKWNVRFPFHNLNNPELTGKEKKTALRVTPGAKSQNKNIIRMMKIYSWNTGRSILGISYSLFEKLVAGKNIDERVARILLEKPELVVLDEGHTPRNERSNIWNVLLKLQTQKRVILSGTPFQNNFGELFNTLRLVRPAFADDLAEEGSFPELIQSRRKLKGRNPQSNSILSDSSVEKLKHAMSPFVHVHKGTILRQSLPGLRDCLVLLNPPELQKRLIEGLDKYSSTFEFQHKAALISVHPYLVKFCVSSEKQIHGIDQGAIESSKLDPNEGVKTRFIIELIRLSLNLNEKVLIFSQYIQPLELIKEQIQQVFDWGGDRQILQMGGKLDQKQRQLMINKFNDPNSEAKVLLASTKCCSEGISLVGASRLVLLDVVWNPSVERQAISRAYRIGQKKFVYTYHLMTCGTHEGDKYIRQADKERLSELVFTSSSNEIDNRTKHAAAGTIEDGILEEMICHEKLRGMFEKIINQPKEADLFQSFGLNY